MAEDHPPAGAAAIADVTLDPNDPSTAFVVDDNQVFRSSNCGASWQDVTFDFGSISARGFRTIEFVTRPAAASVVAIGSRSAVFTLPADRRQQMAHSWRRLAQCAGL